MIRKRKSVKKKKEKYQKGSERNEERKKQFI